MQVGDLVRARYNTSLLGIITEIKRTYYGCKDTTEYIVLWNNGCTGFLYGSYLVPINKVEKNT